jgi:hypothetical protein
MTSDEIGRPAVVSQGQSPGGVMASLEDALTGLRQWWGANADAIANLLAWASVSFHSAQTLERSGWLPHYTTPDLPLNLDGEAADALLSRHYIEQWPEVEAAFIERIGGYDVDDEAKACFNEALQAHGAGLYRVAPRLLFPELERLFREELGDAIKVSSSLRGLRNAASELSGDTIIRTGVLTLRLYSAFAERIYARAETDEEIARARADPVPNRNAAIHGRVSYNTQKSSLNALFIAEFVLLTVNAVRSNLKAAQSGITVEINGNPDFTSDIGFPHVAGARNWRRSFELAVELNAPSVTLSGAREISEVTED